VLVKTMMGWAPLVLVSALAAAACSSDSVDASMGARCTAAADCTDRCLPAGAQFPGGMCSRDCASDAECPSDAVCASVATGVCLYSCRDDGDCTFLGSVNGQAWTCQVDSSGQGAGKKVCLGPGGAN
jgi:hypothetical protein